MESDSYSKHLLVFEKLVTSFTIVNVLEFGMGRYTTPFFVKRCQSVVSVEQDSETVYELMRSEIRSPNWEPIFECNPAMIFDHFDRHNRRFDLVFSDGSPQTRHLIANIAMRQSVPFIVLHDAEKVWHYHWNMLDIPKEYYRFNFRHRDGSHKVTSILANKNHEAIEKWDIAEHDRVLHAYAGPKQPIVEIMLNKPQ